MLEDQVLDPDGTRTLPGLLSDYRVLDTFLVLGAEAVAVLAPAIRFTLLQGAGTLIRYIGHDLAASPLSALARGRAPG